MQPIEHLALAALPLLAGCSAPQSAVVNLESLLGRMTDRSAIASWPEPEFVCAQSSSYDRDSVAPDQEGWFANGDRSQFLRTEETHGRTEHVLLDQRGPGALVRFWATWDGAGEEEFSNGTLRIYLDEQPEPTIEAPIAEAISGGLLAPAPLSQFVSPDAPEASRAHNLYLPIPYARHCKVTYETDVLIDRGGHHGEALYYQINHVTYPEGTPVETYSAAVRARAGAAIEAACRALAAGPVEEPRDRCRAAGSIPAGAAETLTWEGSRALHAISLSLQAEDRAQALRSTVIELQFDGERTVWCPLDAFFGCGTAQSATRSWYTAVDAERMTARWVMPFQSSATLTLHNLGMQPIEFALDVDHAAWAWDLRSMHFHASWYELHAHEVSAGTSGTAEDVNFVTIEGQGVYVGDTLTVFNTTRAWWGEGDEKIWVDDDAFPSHFGTGTEDYYGYAWCRPEVFAAPFHAQPLGAGNFEPGLTVNSRYRSLDAIPFQRRLQMDMELWHWHDATIHYAPAVFWYALPGARCNVQPEPDLVRLPIARKRADLVAIHVEPGVLEGESLARSDVAHGVVEVQSHDQFGWSSEEQVWWRDGEIGDRLEFTLPTLAPGRYEARAHLTRAADYAIVQFWLNGTPLGAPFDGYHDGVVSGDFELGTAEIAAGENTLAVEIVGRNEAAIDRRMFGLDYLRLEPTR